MFVCCDESGIDGKKGWATFGTLWIPNDAGVPAFEGAAIAMRQRRKCWGEMKWNNVDARYADAYGDLLDLAFKIPGIRFACINVDKKLLTNEELARYHAEGGLDEAYMKFLSLLLKWRMRDRMAERTQCLTLLFDEMSGPKDVTGKFPAFVRRNFATAAAASPHDGHELAHLSRVDSRLLHTMQVVDLLSGAMASSLSGRLGSGRRGEACRGLIGRIETWAGGPLTAPERTRHGERFSTWAWKPPTKKQAGAVPPADVPF